MLYEEVSRHLDEMFDELEKKLEKAINLRFGEDYDIEEVAEHAHCVKGATEDIYYLDNEVVAVLNWKLDYLLEDHPCNYAG